MTKMSQLLAMALNQTKHECKLESLWKVSSPFFVQFEPFVTLSEPTLMIETIQKTLNYNPHTQSD